MVKDKKSKIITATTSILQIITGKLKSCAPKSNIGQRILSSAILLLIAIYAIYFSKTIFLILVIGLTILISFEWLEIVRSSDNQRKWRLIGFFYILIPIWSILEIRNINPNILLWMFSIIWTTDIAAYFVGKNFQGPEHLL